MRKFIIMILLNAFLASSLKAATIPSQKDSLVSVNAFSFTMKDIAGMKLKDLEKITGKKLSLKEKIAFKILQWKIKKGLTHEGTNKKDKSKTAMILGIIGLASLFIPYLIVVSIPCTVLALVFGYEARKINPEDSKARTAIILGWISVGLYILALALVIAILATWSWGW